MGNVPVPEHESTPPKKIEYLVFSVGAIRGLAFIDALDELSKYRTLKDLRGLAGSSAGSMMCLAVALGLSRDEMLRFFAESDWFIRTPWKLAFSCGLLSLIDTEPLEKAMREMLTRKGVDPDVTFDKFAPHLDLRIVSYNLTELQAQIFSRATTPQLPVVKAVVASCAMPFVLPPVVFDQLPKKCFVDGYVKDEFPLSQFSFSRDTTLGFYLFDRYRRQGPIRELFAKFKPEDRVVSIDVSRLGLLDWNPSDALRSWVLQQGRAAVARYFSRS